MVGRRHVTIEPDQLRIPAELDRLAEVRAFVRRVAMTAGADQGCIDDLVQAVDEAAANSVVHGFAGRPGWIEVAIDRTETDLVVTITDDAPPFDPTLLPDPDMRIPALTRGPGGMGIRLMRLATDAMDYRPRDGGGNILTFTRALAPRPKEDR